MSERNRSSLSRTAASASSFCSMRPFCPCGTGHPDDEEEDEAAHDGERGGLCRTGSTDGEPPLPDAELADGHPEQAPHHHRPPRPRTALGDVLEGDEGVGPPQHGSPAGQVDDAGDRRHLDRHPEVERQGPRTTVVDAVDEEVADRHGDEDGQPQPRRLVRDVVEVHQHQDGEEGERAHEVAEQRRVQHGPRHAGRQQIRPEIVVRQPDVRLICHGPLSGRSGLFRPSGIGGGRVLT